jgi:site-specific DNA-methyltransferase (adenine-specific)
LINTIVQGECSEVLSLIPSQFIDLIYCDILFNTGRKFNDYDDRLGSNERAIEWYRPRVEEMRRVLKETGSIFIHCDSYLSHYFKVLLDSIFGQENFINEIIWCYRQGGRGNRAFAKKHDVIFFYSKSHDYTFNGDAVRIPYEGTGGYVRNNNGNWVNGKIYKPNPLGKIPEDWWDIPALTPTSKERIGYDTQKPIALLERIIKTGSNEGDIVADFFCGSGTTLVAAAQLGRKYIGCDINQKAVNITNLRLKQVKTANRVVQQTLL